MRHFISFAAGLAAILGTASGCTNRDAIGIDTPHGRVRMDKSETLRLVFASEPPSLDFQKMSDALSAEIMVNLMDTLVEYDLTKKEIGLRPGLALKWVPRDGGRKWTITLRPGVKWTDGVEFTAQQVIDGWKRLLSPATAAVYAYFLFYVKNAKAFNGGTVKDFAQVGARVSGPLEVEVELERPLSYFPQLLTHHSTSPVRLDVIEKFGDRWTEAGNLQTLGAFKLMAWQHDKLVALERNDGYWGAKAKIRYVVGHIINEASTATNLFEAGQIDALNTLASSEIRALKKRTQFHSIGGLVTYFFGFNVTKPPLDNVDLRRALVRAVDRRQITDMLAGGQRPIGGILPPDVFGFDDRLGLSFDPPEARRLLAKAGYSPAHRPARLTLKINANDDWQKVAENVQAQLRKNLGIEVEILAEDWKVFLSGLRTDAPHLFRWGWLADYPDPDNFMNLMTSSSENNLMNWKNPRYDRLVAAGASEADPEARRRIYREAQAIMLEEDVPLLPLYAGTNFFLISDRIKNYPMNALRRYRYDQTEIVETK